MSTIKALILIMKNAFFAQILARSGCYGYVYYPKYFVSVMTMSYKPKTFHFISGLPRSGSTLLSALLIQNPDVHAAMASPLGPLYGAVSSHLSAKNEVYSHISDVSRERILRGLFDNYYSYTDKKIIFDSGRYWTSKMSMIVKLFPSAKMICCIRPVEEIVSSFEKLLDSNPLESTAMFGFSSDGNLYSRAEYLRSSKGMIGTALNNLKQAYYGPFSDRLLLVPYDRLVAEPIEVLRQIYDFTGLDPFIHNPQSVEYSADEVDRRLGAKGLHTVRGPVSARANEPRLPPELIRSCRVSNFWANPLELGASQARIL